jgi:hypothetical protein
MASQYISLPPTSGSSGVASLNSLTGALSLVAGPGISITPSSPDITITNTSPATPPPGDIQIWLTTRTNNGSMGTSVWCMTVLLKDTGTTPGYWTYTSDPVNGDYITVLKAGMYSLEGVNYTENGGGSQFGYTINSPNLTQVVQTITDSAVPFRQYTPQYYVVAGGCTQFINVNDVLRIQDDKSPVTPLHSQYMRLTFLRA